MLKPINLITFLITLLLSNFSFAQKKDFEAGYIIKEKDTISGFILRESESNLSKGVTFKKTIESERIIYTPNDLKGFSFIEDSLHFEAIDYSISIQDSVSQKRFGKILLKGFTDLYKLQLEATEFPPVYMQDNNYVLVLRKEGQYITLGQYEEIVDQIYKLKKKYIGLLRALLSDCDKLATYDYDKLPFEEEKIIELITAYNDCNGQTFSTKTFIHKVKAVRRTGIELFVGGILPVVNKNLENGTVIGIGYFHDVFKKDDSRKSSLTIGINYMYVHYDYLQYISYYKSTYEKIKEHYLTIPFHQQINLSNYKSKTIPFLYGGLAASINTNDSFSYLDIIPFIDLGAGAYIHRIKISATLANTGLSLKSEKLINLGIGWRFQ